MHFLKTFKIVFSTFSSFSIGHFLLGKRQGLSQWIGPYFPTIFYPTYFRGLLVQMAGQWAAASSCQFPNFPDLRVRRGLRQPTGAVGAVEAGNLLHGKLLQCHTAKTVALQKN